MSNRTLGHLWLLLSCIALLLSGGLALIITFAKVPGVKEMVRDLDWIRWCLTIHVNLSTMVWFTALPAGLVNFMAHSNAKENSSASFLQILGFILSCLGVVVFSSAWPGADRQVLMSNYVPVVLHAQFFIGLGLYVIGVAINYLSLRVLRPDYKGAFHELPGLSESGFGLWVGVIFYFFALITFVFGYVELEGAGAAYVLEYFERLMWGSGHLMQHSTSVFSMVVWVLLISSIIGRSILTRAELFPFFAVMGLSLFFVPILWMMPILEDESRRGFTTLMQWGIAPAYLAFFAIIAKKLKENNFFNKADYRSVAMVYSFILMNLGFIYGAAIRGSDLRIPGHYHAAIGSVTIVFMALVYHILSRKSACRWIYRAMCTFGIGQILFASGMFWAGVQGVGRKTYGAEHAAKSIGQYLSFGAMALGGILAFTAGIFFAVAIWPHLRLRSRLREF